MFKFLKIWNLKFSTTSDGQTSITKVVDLEKLCNFVVDNFFIWSYLIKENYVWISQIWNLNFSNNLGWRKNQNKSCRSRKVIQLCSWQRFYLKSSFSRKTTFEFHTFEIWIFQTTSDEKTAKTKVVDLKRVCNFVVDNFFIWIV